MQETWQIVRVSHDSFLCLKSREIIVFLCSLFSSKVMVDGEDVDFTLTLSLASDLAFVIALFFAKLIDLIFVNTLT